jgi:hypothetical protein
MVISISTSFPLFLMGCAPSRPVDLATEVSLYHFDLHRVVGKGAFGKVPRPSYLLPYPSHPLVSRSALSNTKRAEHSMHSSTLTSNGASNRRLLPMSSRKGDYSKRCGTAPRASITVSPLRCRSITPSWSTSVMHSRTMIIVSSCLISCSVAIFDVSPDFTRRTIFTKSC